MSDASASPEVHDDERLDIDGEVEPEEVMDDEADGIVDVEEEEKPDHEGLDLEMNEDDGGDESYGDHENGLQNGEDEEEEDEEEEHEEHEEQANADLGESVEAAMVENEVVEVAKKPEVKKEERKEVVKAYGNDDEELRHLLSRPPHGSEVFIGGVTRDTNEDDLRELCSPCGEIFEVRILKDKETGNNKGYAFVTFTNRETAEKAIETMSNSELKGRKLRFSHSQAKHRLFIGNVPKTWDSPELEKILSEEGPGVESVELLKDPRNPGKNRGFAFVEYYNHACADHARKVMSRSSFRLGSNSPTVSWADPRSGNETAASSQNLQIKVVYVRNLPDAVTEEQLKNLFEHHGEITKVVLPQSKPGQPKRDFGFVHFADRNDALKAIEKTEKYELEGRLLETSLAKPPMEKKGLEQSAAPQRLGLLSQLQQSRNTYNYPVDVYNNMSGYGQNRYNQPLIYGRGPPPAGMTMVPIQLPDGRLGYVLQQPGIQQGGQFGGRGVLSSSYNRNSNNNSSNNNNNHSGGSGGGSSSRRYRPY